MKLSIVIPVFNKWNFTKSCLTDLAKLSNGHEIIIIDNASSDETSKDLASFMVSLNASCGMVPTRNEENTFHSKACNQGFRLAHGDYVCFLNNDIRVKSNHQNWTDALISACDSTNGIVGPTMGQLDNKLNFVREANEQLTGHSYLGGWCIAAKREVWEKVKIPNTNQVWNEEFPFYFNDTDLSFRARQLSIPLTVVKLPDVVHFGKVSAAQVNIPKLYQEGRNVFLRKWAGKNR